MVQYNLPDAPGLGLAPKLFGGCLCGAVRYGARPVGEVVHCHCRMCQRSSGAAFATWVRASTAHVEIAGTLEHFRSAPPCRRAFCPCCGSSLLMDYDSEDGVWLALGTLDDPEAVTPGSSIWTNSRLACVMTFDAELPNFRQEAS